jgi:hypothetical protein
MRKIRPEVTPSPCPHQNVRHPPPPHWGVGPLEQGYPSPLPLWARKTFRQQRGFHWSLRRWWDFRPCQTRGVPPLICPKGYPPSKKVSYPPPPPQGGRPLRQRVPPWPPLVRAGPAFLRLQSGPDAGSVSWFCRFFPSRKPNYFLCQKSESFNRKYGQSGPLKQDPSLQISMHLRAPVLSSIYGTFRSRFPRLWAS